MAVAWAAGTWPAQATEERFADAARAAARAAADAADGRAAATRAAAYATARAAAVATATARTTARAAADAARAAARAAAADAANHNLWKEISIDCFFLVESESPAELCGRALWSYAVPAPLRAAWTDLSTRLLALDQDWHVWTDWYEDRLAGPRGRPMIEQLELDRVFVPTKDDWEKGPARVNEILAELERKYRPPEDQEEHSLQDPRGLRFTNRGDQIDADPTAGSDGVGTDQASKDLHDNFRKALQSLRASAEGHRGQVNWLGDAAEIATEILDGLGQTPEGVRPGLVVSGAKRLEREFEAEEKKQRDPELEGSPLNADQYKALANATEAGWGYIHSDDALARFEANFRRRSSHPPPLDTSRAIVDKAVAAGAVTEDAKAQLDRVDRSSEPGTTVNVETKRNVVRGGLRIVLSGALVVTRTQPVAKWLIEAEEEIVAEFEGNPRAQRWMRGVIAWVKKLPLAKGK